MAVPPMIPTSFVPHPAMGPNSRAGDQLSFMTLLSGLGYLALTFAILSAGGVFIYNRILATQLQNKETQLAAAEASLDQATIEQFLRLSERFTSAKTLLDSHIALSGLFDLLESVTPDNVRFSGVNVVIDDTGAATLQANGVAKSFNTLAVASNDFSTDARLKNAIFSNISINTGGSVKFALSATLDPKLIVYTAGGASAVIPATSVPVATTTATTTP